MDLVIVLFLDIKEALVIWVCNELIHKDNSWYKFIEFCIYCPIQIYV